MQDKIRNILYSGFINNERVSFMTRGGSRQGSGRPLKTEGEKREVLNCRIKASNKQWLEQERKRSEKSIGELVDLAIELLQANPKAQFPKVEG